MMLVSTAILCAGLMSGHANAQVASPCGVPAYPSSLVPTGMSSLDPLRGPIILFNPGFFQSLGQSGPPMFRYMLTHECAHHLNGDVVAGMTNPQGMLMINPQVELRADCSAAQYLRSQNDLQALQIAIQYWAQYGNMPTGPNYPTGLQRAQMLSNC